MKKYLALLLAMLMLVSSVGMNVFAAGNTCNHKISVNDEEFTKRVYPTCTERGYTVYYCTLCGEEVSRDNYTETSLGHSIDAGKFILADDGVTYRKEYTCTREFRDENGDSYSCGHSYIETEGTDEVVYYVVNFVNNRVVTKEAYYKDVNGVDLIDTTKLITEPIDSFYVKAGTAGEYDVKPPYLGKTAAFAEHIFIGWTTNSNLPIAAEYADEVYMPLTKAIEGNTTLYPVFAGKKIEHPVTFFSLEGKITHTQFIEHGGTPVYRVNANPSGDLYPDPQKPEDLVNTYEFNGWSRNSNDEEGIKTVDVEKTPIYEGIEYRPTYKAIPKDYTVLFYSHDMKLIQRFDNINLATNLLTSADKLTIGSSEVTVANAIASFNNAQYLAKLPDATYNYVWSGKWRVLQKTDADGSDVLGNYADLSNFNISSEKDFYVDKDDQGNEYKIIRLVPEYNKVAVVYHVGVKMVLPDSEDKDYYRGEAAVRVFDHNNQLVASGKTNADGTFRCKLNNIEGRSYTVKVTTIDSKYIGETTISSNFQKDPSGDAEEEAMLLNVCSVVMHRNPEYETSCSCIHHNALLQPIWVRILNILYSLFNIRYECCYDMYSTIGPLLEYTAQ